MDVWGTISEGKPSSRTEIVYNAEPFRAGIRRGDWKLIWRTLMPQWVELYNIAEDPSETKNLAAGYPKKVVELQKRANQLAAEAEGGGHGMSACNPKRTFSFTQARHGVPPVPSKSGSIGLAPGRQ